MIKKKLAKKMRQNRPIPYWIRMRTDNTISVYQWVLSIFGFGVQVQRQAKALAPYQAR
ncbi:hypothetical protein Gogos_016090, partial [Gossypium gossypioides]|nr:hypothetical protein [Gossypium gossypioides]